MRSSRNRRVCGFSRIGPMVVRIVAVVPESATRNTNFCQISRRISALSSALMPPRRHSSRNCSARGEDVAVEFAEHQALQRPGTADDTGTRDRSRNIACPPSVDPLRAEGVGEVVVLEYAVLERDHHGLRTHDRLDLGERRLGIPQLDGKDDEVGDADAGGIVSGGDLRKKWNSSGPVMVRPCSRMAARWEPRATKATAAPPLARRAPK